MSTGWNLLSCYIETPDSTTGSETKTTLDYCYINLATALATSTIALGDWIMDLWHLADDPADFIRSITTGYPIFDEINNQTTLRWNIFANEATGYLIDSFDVQNTDTTEKSFNIIAVSTPESKGDTDEFIIESRYRRSS